MQQRDLPCRYSMSPLTCLRAFLMIGVVLIPTIKGLPLEADLDQLELRELLQEMLGKRNTNDVQSRIRELNDKYAQHITNNNIDAIKDMYDPEAILITGDSIEKGLKASRYNWIEYVDQAEIVTDEVLALDAEGAFVFERKHFTMSTSSGNVLNSGRVSVIWKKSSGTYKVYIEISDPQKA